MKALRKKTSTVTPKVKKTVKLKAKNKVTKKLEDKVKKVKKGETSPKASRQGKTKKIKFPVRQNRGVVYISHIPHGFYEDEMRSYFSQFGVVTNINMPRSKFGKSKGYAFIEFLHPEVAKVAAESMNNYLMMNRLIKTTYIPPEEQKPECFKFKSTRQEKYEKNAKIHVERLNQTLSPDREQKRLVRQMKKIKSLHKKLAMNNIDFDFQVNASDAVLKKVRKLDPEEPQEDAPKAEEAPPKSPEKKKSPKPKKEKPSPVGEEKPRKPKESQKSPGLIKRAAEKISLKSKRNKSSSKPNETKVPAKRKEVKKPQIMKAKNTRQLRKKLETEV